MNTSIIAVDYDNTPVLFQADAFINATSIAAKFGKKAKDYLKTERTTEYINALVSHLNLASDPNRTKIPFEQNHLVIVKKGSSENGGGTWLHPKLAIDFARWLSADFAVWCDLQIEKILHPAQYGIKALSTLPAPRAKTYIPGGLELHQQDAINDMIAERIQHVPQDLKAKTKISIYSAILTKFNVPKGTKGGYKTIDPRHFESITQLIARLPIDDGLVTLTRQEFEQLKALPAPEAKPEILTSDALQKQLPNAFSITLAPNPGQPKRWLVTQNTDETVYLMPLDSRQMIVSSMDMIKELSDRGHAVAELTESGLRSMVMGHIPIRLVPALLDAGMERMNRIGWEIPQRQA